MITQAGIPTNKENAPYLLHPDTNNQVEELLSATPRYTIPNQADEERRAQSMSYPWTKDSRVNKHSTQELPIATPVPLPYTARSIAVLRSMVSSGPVQALPGNSLEEQLLQSEASPGDEAGDTAILQKERITRHITPTAPTFKPVFRPIRPVSPSTLMALTEPCLMAWCTESSRPTLLPPPPIYHSYPAPVQMTNPQIQRAFGQQGRNLWGY